MNTNKILPTQEQQKSSKRLYLAFGFALLITVFVTAGLVYHYTKVNTKPVTKTKIIHSATKEDKQSVAATSESSDKQATTKTGVTINLNGETIQTKISTSATDATTLYQFPDTNNPVIFAKDGSDFSYTIQDLQINETIIVNNKTYTVINSNIVTDSQAREMLYNNSAPIVGLYTHDARGNNIVIIAQAQ